MKVQEFNDANIKGLNFRFLHVSFVGFVHPDSTFIEY